MSIWTGNSGGIVNQGGGLTPAQLAKLNAFPNFAPRVEVITEGVQGVQAVAEATAEVLVDLELTAINARVHFIATAAGAASNGIRVKLETTSVAANFDTLWPEVGSNNRDWSIRIDASRAHTINEIAQIIAVSPLNPPFTLSAVDPIHTTISFPYTNWAVLQGGANEVIGVAHVDEVTETHQPADGDVMVFTGANTAVNNKALRYGPVQSASFDITLASRFVAGDAEITLANEVKDYEFNIGKYAPSINYDAVWYKFHHAHWLNLPAVTPNIQAIASNSLIFADTTRGGSSDIYFGRGANNRLLIATTATNADLLPFTIREIL